MEIIRILNLLSDKTRLKILRLLGEGEKSVSKIVKSSKLSQPTISHHLKKLEEAGLIIKRRYKKWVLYSTNLDFLRLFIKKLGLELDL
jgi:ArsR family transcriptional regulator